MLSRRTLLSTPLALIATRAVAVAAGKMTLAIHQNTSSGAGYRKSLEGWSRAGIKHVEITAALLDDFLKADTLAAAGRVLSDLGLTPVCAACGVGGLWEPNPGRAASLDAFKKRCEMFATLGLTRIYSPTGTTLKFTEEDYKAGPDNIRQVGEIAKQFRLTVMAEFIRTSSYISTLPTLLKMTRTAAHPNMAISVRLLPLLVRPQQARGSRSDPSRRNRPRALPGCSRSPTRAVGQYNPDYPG